MKKKPFFEYLFELPLYAPGCRDMKADDKTDRYIDEGINISPILFLLAFRAYPYNYYNGFYMW